MILMKQNILVDFGQFCTDGTDRSVRIATFPKCEFDRRNEYVVVGNFVTRGRQNSKYIQLVTELNNANDRKDWLCPKF